ncbi:MAG: ATP-binding protein [Bacteroidetes bacterium]|nr:MAG: ATP-binding protein [Bacteroidota bacterium]
MISDSTLIDTIKIPSELKNIVEVEKLIDRVCELKGVKEELYGNMLIAVTEAVNNAVIHGNCFQTQKEVEVNVSEQPGRICFSVKDHGSGFDFDNLPDPTAPENIEKENGRGIFLIRNLADELEFESGGSVANIYFSYD